MARKPERNHEAYNKSGFLLYNTHVNCTQYDRLTCMLCMCNVTIPAASTVGFISDINNH